MTEDMPQGKETVTDGDIISAIKEHPDPFVGAIEVSRHFDHTRQWAHSRLQDLHDEGRIERKSVGERSVIWWVSDGGATADSAT